MTIYYLRASLAKRLDEEIQAKRVTLGIGKWLKAQNPAVEGAKDVGYIAGLEKALGILSEEYGKLERDEEGDDGDV